MRLIVYFRLVTLLVAAVSLLLSQPRPGLPLVLAAVGCANLLPLLRWESFAPFLLRHPFTLAIDYVATLAVLVTTGVESPLLSYTLGTAFLAGLLYGWWGAAVFSVLLAAGYESLLLSATTPRPTLTFQLLVGTPSLYLIFAAGAAAVRSVLARQAQIEAELVEARSEAAAGAERARLAREMHDTLGKTLHGMALLAATLPKWVERDPRRAVAESSVLADAAESAALQARDLLAGLRADTLDRPLHEVVRHLVEEWSAESRVPAELRVQPVSGLGPGSRYELSWVLREALRNVSRHAAATSVTVTLEEVGDRVVLTVADDGRGLDVGTDLAELAAAGHYGLVGMRERAERVRGRLSVGRTEPRGTTVTVSVPRTAEASTPSAELVSSP